MPLLNSTALSNAMDGIGYVIVTRRMDLGAGEKKIVFTLMLSQEAGRW